MKPIRFNDTNGRGLRPALQLLRCLPIILVGLFILLNSFVSYAHAETRTLRMYFTHTKESATITFKKNGKYVNSGLKKANRFLRDWRRKEPTKMDPELLDLVWEVYQKSGSKKPIRVISGYRSPRTNNMLRRRGRKVAKKSQHTKGRALDFFMPDVSVAKLRALGLKAHRGGVGYYRGSFVHLDTGSVRHWPRMSSKQLSKVFPKGKTIHVPSNGKPLRGYKVAKANLKRGRNADGSRRKTVVKKTLIASLFNNDGTKTDEEEGAARRRVAAKRPKLAKPVAAASLQSRPKPAGPDPFSIEKNAGGSNKQPNGQKERELAATQLVQAVERGLTGDGRTQKEFVLASLAVPRPRPQTSGAAAATVVADAAAVSPDVEVESEASTRLALAASQALRTGLRPPVDIPQAGSATALASATLTAPPTTLAAATTSIGQSEPEVAGLKARIETALARSRVLTPAEQAAEQQSNSKLAEALKYIPVPSKPQTRPTTTQLALATIPESAPPRESLALAGLKTEGQPEADQSRFGSGSVSEPATPSWRGGPVQINPTAESLQVPLPSPNSFAARSLFANAVSSGEPASSSSYALSLGKLGGRSVKKWAVSLSTRVGLAAELKAPNYRQGTKQAAPDQVFSAGFEQSRFPLRADRFSGRALTRVAFATFKSGN
jgi:uncharacterized protein YcbK (DUF882 family)